MKLSGVRQSGLKRLSSLGAKFSLLLALVWFLGGLATIFTLSQHLNAQAEQTMRERADIVLTAMQAARNYTQNNIQPLVEAQSLALQSSGTASDAAAVDVDAVDLADHSKLVESNLAESKLAESKLAESNLASMDASDYPFIQEIIPNFAARSIFASFRQQDPSFLGYSYKEASINPTNLDDLADGFESELFPQMQTVSELPTERVSGYRVLDGRKLFYLAQPLVMKDASCLACHGSPVDAPKDFVKMYGDQNGFGWKLNQVVAAQMVYVPADMIFARSRQNLWTVTKTFLSIFGALFVVINLLLWRNVVRPLAILTGTAKQISRCSLKPAAALDNISVRQALTDNRVSGELCPSEQALSLADKDLSTLTLRQDEPGQLARAFEYMLYVLNQREQDLQQAVDERTRLLSQEMRDRQAAQSALQTYTHAMNHDLRNVAMGISSVVQGILYRYKRAQDQALVPVSADVNKADSNGANLTEAKSTEDNLTEVKSTEANSTETTGEGASVTVDVEAITLLKASSDRQLKLMDTLMQVRAADTWRSALQHAPVSLRQLTDSMCATYAATMPNTATLTNLISKDLPLAWGDASQIQRVFTNLIDNAVKYNPDGVNIVLSAEPHENRTVRCQVLDDGQGLKATNSKALFEPYHRNNQKVAGYGLGLYICREIIHAHDGDIGVDSSARKGAIFWFTLPLAERV